MSGYVQVKEAEVRVHKPKEKMDVKVKGQLGTEPQLWSRHSIRVTHKIYDDDR